MSEKCITCGVGVSVYMLCDEDDPGGPFCETCFSAHPCGKGEHGEGCPTSVFDDGKPGEPK